MKVPVYLSYKKEPRVGERVFTRNVSPHRARIVTSQEWRPGEEPMITPLIGEFPQTAQVVYCKTRGRGGFYVGLRLMGRSVKWEDSTRTSRWRPHVKKSYSWRKAVMGSTRVARRAGT